MTQTCRRTGFTLIELLVVVGIIALLCAILIPSLTRAVRFQAKTVVCRSNMHGLGSAFYMYAESYRGYFPLTKSTGEDSFYALWKAKLLKNVNLLIDPATKNVVRPETLLWPEAYASGPEGDKVPYLRGPGGEVGDICDKAPKGRDDASGGHSYEYNGVYNGGPDPVYSGKHKKATHFRLFLAQIVLVTDNDDERDDLGSISSLGCNPSMEGNGNNCPQPWDNHGSDGMNMMYADGHALWVRKVSGKWDDQTSDNSSKWKLRDSTNALIDGILARSQHPWNYFHH